MADENIQSLVEGLLLGTLSAAEVQELRRRLDAGDPQVTAAWREARQMLLALPDTVPQTPPPPELKQRILRAAAPAGEGNPKPATVRAMPRRTLWQSAKRSMVWAAVFLLFAVGYGYYNRSQDVFRLRQERAALQQQVQAQQEELESLKRSLAFHLEMTKALQRPQAFLVELKSTKAAPAAARVLVDPESTRAYFIATELEVLEANQDYQLWYLDKMGQPFDAGVFQVDAEGYGQLPVRSLPSNLARISAFAVTIEPKGGSPTPTLAQMVLLGRV